MSTGVENDEMTNDGSEKVTECITQNFFDSLRVISRISTRNLKIIDRVSSIHDTKTKCFILKRYINLEKEIPLATGTQDEETTNGMMAIREIKFLKKLTHPNINRLIADFRTSTSISLLLEDGGKPCLSKRNDGYYNINVNGTYFKESALAVLDESICRHVLRQLIEAVSYLHSMNICHSDIKPGNIVVKGLLPEMVKQIHWNDARSVWEMKEFQNDSSFKNMYDALNVQLVDFDTSQFVIDKVCPCGGTTKAFMPPESLFNAFSDGFAKDVWSLGCVLYILLTASHPIFNNGFTELLYYCDAVQNKVSPVSFRLYPYLSPQVQNLISGMLNPCVEKRFKVEHVKAHCWLTG